jgi:hypothetical protein
MVIYASVYIRTLQIFSFSIFLFYNLKIYSLWGGEIMIVFTYLQIVFSPINK